MLATVVEGAGLGTWLRVFADGRVDGAGALPREPIRDAALSALRREASGTITVETPAGETSVFLEVFPRQPRLVIFGGVHIAVALVPLARMLGYRTIVADGRQSFLTRERFPLADELILGWPEEAFERIHAAFPLEPVDPAYHGEVAARYRYVDGQGEIGVITSVTSPFCGTCTRARISAEGKLYTCLFAARGTDLRALLRSGASDEELAAAIEAVWARRADRYSEIRTEQTSQRPRVEMSYIGG